MRAVQSCCGSRGHAAGFTAAMHTELPQRVINVISGVRLSLPV
jgi:hypothetical protein